MSVETIAPPIPNGTNHFGITVEDLERSLGFYRDLLGLEVVASWVRDEPYIEKLVGYPGVALDAAILKLPATDVLLEIIEYRNVERTPVDPATANPGVAHLCLFVPDLEPFYEKLTAAGIRSVSAPVEPTIGPNKGGRAVYMIDPDGIRVELVQTTRLLTGEKRG